MSTELKPNEVFCRECGKSINQKAVVCPHCGCSTGASSGKEWSKNTRSALFVVTFFMPLVGWIAGFIGLFNDQNRGYGIGLILWGFLAWALWFFIIIGVGMSL